jgi:hypothetical protein
MYAFHNPSSKSLSLIFFKDIDIAKVSECSIIRYQTSQTYLGFIMKNTKIKAAFY